MAYPSVYPVAHPGLVSQPLAAERPSHSIHVGAPNVNIDVHTTRGRIAQNPEKQVRVVCCCCCYRCGLSHGFCGWPCDWRLSITSQLLTSTQYTALLPFFFYFSPLKEGRSAAHANHQ